ncbi:MFS transporter [Fodinicola feengrottensis]|uniref:MFS transporter n=1 Tax=Fodinicola feengrottensis TaxID=435914 RepID=UPI0013D1DE75|nr:MFS transporter [Fodinicola feengrottensis]
MANVVVRHLRTTLVAETSAGRLLVLTSLLGSIGLGLYQAGSAVYFVHVIGFSGVQVGSGLSAAGLAGLALGIPIGRLADRLGPREVTVAVCVLKAIPLAVFPLAGHYWVFLLTAVVFGVADAGWNVANEAVIAGTMSGSHRVRLSAQLRSIYNIGMTAGALLAGLAVAANVPAAYFGLFWGYAVTTLITAALYLRLPHVPGTGAVHASVHRLAALSDLPYLAVAQVSGLALLSETVLEIGLPLWVVTQTTAPRWLVPGLLAVNTVLVVIFQARAARGAETIPGAVRTLQISFVALIAMCVLAAVSAAVPVWAAVLVLVASVVALTGGEMGSSAARWCMRFSFAPEGDRVSTARFSGSARLARGSSAR